MNEQHGSATIGRPMRRRAITIVALVVGILLGGATVAWASHEFTDVPTNAPYHADVSWALDRGLIAPCAVDKFCPNDPVKRGDLASYLHRLAPKHTPFQLPNNLDSSAVGATPIRLADVGVFVKSRRETAIKVTWQASMRARKLLGLGYCRFETRIDGVAGRGGTTMLPASTATTYSSGTSVGLWTTNIPSGQHAVSIWVSGTADQCQLNVGNFPGQYGFVEEYTEGTG